MAEMVTKRLLGSVTVMLPVLFIGWMIINPPVADKLIMTFECTACGHCPLCDGEYLTLDKIYQSSDDSQETNKKD